MRRTCASLLALSLSLCVLGSAPGFAASRRAAPERSSGSVGAPARGASPLWGAFASGFPGLAALWEKIGCKMDPNGLCIAESGSASGEIGCKADPDGLCAPL